MKCGLSAIGAVLAGVLFAPSARAADREIAPPLPAPAPPADDVAIVSDETTLGAAAAAPLPRDRRTTPSAARSPRLVWDPRWPRFRVIEYGATITAFEMLGFIEFRMKLPKTPRWKGPILFDKAARSVFLLHDAKARLTAASIADALALADEIEPALASIVPPLIDGANLDVAWQMLTIDLEAQAFTGLSQRSLMFIGQRARPYYDACKKDPHYATCGGPIASFPSGHSSSAFVGAGTSCAHHLHLPLYGGGAPDILTCVALLMTASGASISRMMADDHWASDVILGSSLGLFFGYGFPTLLHYHALLPSVDKPNLHAMFLPDVDGDKWGAKVVGTF